MHIKDFIEYFIFSDLTYSLKYNIAKKYYTKEGQELARKILFNFDEILENCTEKEKKYFYNELEKRKHLILNMFNDLKILEEIEKFSKKAINFKLIDERSTVFNSKIGGLPYLPLNMEYPKSKVDNKPLRFLAQINFEELPYIKDFMKKGILQFFLKEDENLGCNFKLDSNDDIKIIYHKDIIKDKTKLYSDLSNIIFNDKNFPFKLNYERKLKGVLESSYYSDLFSDKIISYINKNQKNINKMCFQYIQKMGLSFYEALELNWYDFVSSSVPVVQMQGYPHFMNEKIKKVEDMLLLIQFDSILEDENYINWGNCIGISQFFIKKEDLKNLNFSNVIYNWESS